MPWISHEQVETVLDKPWASYDQVMGKQAMKKKLASDKQIVNKSLSSYEQVGS